MEIDNLRNELKKYPGFFGKDGEFYQSLEGVVSDSEARRPTKERLKNYGVLDILDENSKVLDIGSNCGFISLSVAKHVKSVLGLEKSSKLVNIANMAKDIVNQSNCQFKKVKFEKFNTEEKYNVVFTLAIHHWVKMTFVEFVDKVVSMMEENSYLMFESHDIRNRYYDTDINRKRRYLEKYFERVVTGNVPTNDKNNREREFYLMKRRVKGKTIG